LKRRGIAITAILAGSATAESAEYEAGLKRMAAEEGVTVHFLGYRDDVSELMQTGDIVVIPSLTEAQPRVAVQAFATGRPVVASAVGGVPEIVKDGETGWLVPPAQPDILAEAIARVVQHPDEAAKVAQGARQLAEQRMRFDHRMAETLDTYRTAIARAKTRRFLRVKP
jgi:glycosyltransferase involved in cell wall biosynthesis